MTLNGWEPCKVVSSFFKVYMFKEPQTAHGTPYSVKWTNVFCKLTNSKIEFKGLIWWIIRRQHWMCNLILLILFLVVLMMFY